MFDTWLVVAAALVFFMQGGFTALECGLVRGKNVKSVAFKNLIDCTITTLVFPLIGFALMFGEGRFAGGSLFGLEHLPTGEPDAHLFALYQLGFAATTVTIVSGACWCMSEVGAVASSSLSLPSTRCDGAQFGWGFTVTILLCVAFDSAIGF